MKIIVCVLLLISSSLIFYSCNSDSIIGPAVLKNFEWQLKDSLIGENVYNASMADEDNIYLGAVGKGIRINNGVKSTINFDNPNFMPSAVDAYNTNYYAYAGPNGDGSPTTSLKIFNGGTLTTVVINSDSNLVVGAIKILQPGKILISVDKTFYVYENEGLTAYRLGVDGFGYYIAVQADKIFLAVTTYSGYQQVYKFENNALTLIDNLNTGHMKLATDYAILNMIQLDKTYISYYDASGQKPLFSDNVKHSYFYSAGQDLNRIYFLGFDNADSNRVIGMIWNGTELYKDANFPIKRDEFSVSLGISNMRNGVFYLCKNNGANSYVYKAKYFITTPTEN